MIVKRLFTSLIFLELVADVLPHVEIEAEDYFFPLEPVINFCKMSDQCQHDFVAICGQDSLGISRMFNDNCDMYEYNCDEKKPHEHNDLDYKGVAMHRQIYLDVDFFSCINKLTDVLPDEYRHVKIDVCKYEAAASERT